MVTWLTYPRPNRRGLIEAAISIACLACFFAIRALTGAASLKP